MLVINSFLFISCKDYVQYYTEALRSLRGTNWDFIFQIIPWLLVRPFAWNQRLALLFLRLVINSRSCKQKDG